MGINRIATPKKGNIAFIIEADGKRMTGLRDDPTLSTTAKMDTEARKVFSKNVMDHITFHKNGDGTIAIAWQKIPGVYTGGWPEDGNKEILVS